MRRPPRLLPRKRRRSRFQLTPTVVTPTSNCHLSRSLISTWTLTTQRLQSFRNRKPSVREMQRSAKPSLAVLPSSGWARSLRSGPTMRARRTFASKLRRTWSSRPGTMRSRTLATTL
ncbi:hypothetical protein ACFPRL_09605 [Pseudoclavibacter helvolus]